MLDMEDPVVNQMDFSILAYLGNAIAWIFAPLGFGNWQGAVATITGLVAKENVVSTFGVLFGLADAGETDPGPLDGGFHYASHDGRKTLLPGI